MEVFGVDWTPHDLADWFLLAVMGAGPLYAVVLVFQGIGEWREKRRAALHARIQALREERAREEAQREEARRRRAPRVGQPRWRVVAQRYGRKCWLCGARTYVSDSVKSRGCVVKVGATYPSVDHVVPVSLGGGHEMENLRIAHVLCNSRRQANTSRTKFPPPDPTYR